MGFIKFTGPFLNEEFNSFFRTFGYTQQIDIDTPRSLTTANQFSEQYLRLYITSEKQRGYGNNRRTIPAQNIPDYEPLKIINLWSVWADIQEKPVEKQKFYLMDNKLLFSGFHEQNKIISLRQETTTPSRDIRKPNSEKQQEGGFVCTAPLLQTKKVISHLNSAYQ